MSGRKHVHVHGRVHNVRHNCTHRTVLGPSGDVYAGSYGSGGLRDGMGVLRTVDKAVYAGAWKRGTRHGEGLMLYADGCRCAVSVASTVWVRRA